MNGTKRERNIDDEELPDRDSIEATTKQQEIRMRSELESKPETIGCMNGAKRYMPIIIYRYQR
jgi:hypothetical protein